MKIVKKKSTKNSHFYSREKSLYVPWACFCNETDSHSDQPGHSRSLISLRCLLNGLATCVEYS